MLTVRVSGLSIALHGCVPCLTHPSCALLLHACPPRSPACPCLVVELMDTSLDKVLYGGVNAAGPAAPAGGAGAGGGCLSPRSQAPLLPLPKVGKLHLQHH